MPYNAAAAASNRETKEASQVESFIQQIAQALRLASEPATPPPSEIVTVGESSDPKLDRLVYCSDCLDSKDGSPWPPHKLYFWVNDEARPGRLKRIENLHAHPAVRKTLSYDARAAREGIEKGTHGKQCIQCGHPLRVAV